MPLSSFVRAAWAKSYLDFSASDFFFSSGFYYWAGWGIVTGASGTGDEAFFAEDGVSQASTNDNDVLGL